MEKVTFVAKWHALMGSPLDTPLLQGHLNPEVSYLTRETETPSIGLAPGSYFLLTL